MKTEPYVVLIEDNDDDVTLIRRVFDKANISTPIIVINDGADALDYFEGRGQYQGRDTSNLPKFILLDLKLPRLNGLEVLGYLKQSAPTRELPVIVLTSSSEEQDLLQSYRLGVNSYVRKPVTYAEFSQTVEDIGRYWISLNRSVSG